MQSTQAMTTAMRGVTRAMIGMNQKMNIPEMRRVMMEFEKQNELMTMKEEIMNDTIDGVSGQEAQPYCTVVHFFSVLATHMRMDT